MSESEPPKLNSEVEQTQNGRNYNQRQVSPAGKQDYAEDRNNSEQGNEDARQHAATDHAPHSQDKKDLSVNAETPSGNNDRPQSAAAVFLPPSSAAPSSEGPPPPKKSSKADRNKPKRQYIIKNPNRPKRPLSAYNLFFRHERERIVRETLLESNENLPIEQMIKSQEKTRTGKRVHRKTHGAIGFAELGKRISEAWRNLDSEARSHFEAEAAKEKERYQRELEASLGKLVSGEEETKAARPSDLRLSPEARDSSPTHGNKRPKTSHPEIPSFERDPGHYPYGMPPYDPSYPPHGPHSGMPPMPPPPMHSPSHHHHHHHRHHGYYHDYYGQPRPLDNGGYTPPAFAPPHPSGSGPPPPPGPYGGPYGMSSHPSHSHPFPPPPHPHDGPLHGSYPPYRGYPPGPGYGPPYPPGGGPNGGPGNNNNNNTQTAQAFAPPYPTHPHAPPRSPYESHHPHIMPSGYPPRPPPHGMPGPTKGDDPRMHAPPPPPGEDPSPKNDYPWLPPPPPGPTTHPDFAFQCEVCNNAVFSTFQECAEHEEECARKHGAGSSQPTAPPPPPPGYPEPLPPRRNPSPYERDIRPPYKKDPPHPSHPPQAPAPPTTTTTTRAKSSPAPGNKKRGEEAEQAATRAAVEAVLLLRSANE